MKYLLALLTIRFFELIFIEQFQGNIQIFLWNTLLLLQPILLGLVINKVARDKKIKVVNFVALFVSFVMLINFLSEWVFFEKYDVRLWCNLFIFVVVVPLSANAVFRTLTPKSANFDVKKSYIVLKRPSDFFGLVAALFTAPYGHCSLVTKGKWFKFKKGSLQELDYKHNEDYCLIKIDNVRLSEIRKLLGMKWSLKNNCFTTFNKYKRT